MRWDELEPGDVIVSDLVPSMLWIVLSIEDDSMKWFSVTRSIVGHTNGLSHRGEIESHYQIFKGGGDA